MTRKVTIYNTAGANEQVIESSAMTWGDLQIDLIKNNVRFENLQAVIGETQNTLGSTQSLLIDGDFTLYLIPQKVKSGDYDEDYIDSEGESVSSLMQMSDSDLEHWNVDDYNYVNKNALAYARARKGAIYMEKVARYIVDLEARNYPSSTATNETTRNPADVRAELAENAEKIKRNMGIYD
jgi:hypothetical protein